ncbi:uncharacterized protein MELLADRAFT_77436, partial [Melampsora larici-populina 98AG31]
MQEDLNDLKEMIRLRVDGGQILILEWEEKINSKVPERERQRMMEQNEVEEEGDDEEEVGKGLMANGSKRRKVSDQADSLGLTKGRGTMKSGLMNKQQKKALNHLLPPTLPISFNSQQLHSTSSPLHSDGSNSSHHHPTLSLDPSHRIEELDIFKPTQSIPRHSQYPETYQPTQDFLNQSFINPFQSNLSHLPPTNLLAVSMGLSFALGSVYHYYQMKAFTSPLYTPSTTTNPPSDDLTTYHPDSCGHHRVGFGKLGVLDRGLMRAGIETVSMASMVFVLLVLLKPEFLLSFMKPSYRLSSCTKTKNQKKKKDLVKQEEEDDDRVIDEDDYKSLMKRVDGQIGMLGFGVECFKGLGQLSIFLGFPQFLFLSSLRISLGYEKEKKKKIKIWLRIAELESLNGLNQVSFFCRFLTALKLFNLIDWKMEKQVEGNQRNQEVIRLMIILSLHLR